jgi:hypothetical protein
MQRKRAASDARQPGREQTEEEGGVESEHPVVTLDVRAVPRWLRTMIAQTLLSPLFAVSPILTSLGATGVIVGCNVWARASEHVPAWLSFPAISFTYYEAPEYFLGSLGFFTVMVLFFMMMSPFIAVAFVAVERALVWRVYLTGFLASIAFIFLFLQAAIPMQANTLELLDVRAGLSEEDVPRLRPQTILHQLCAVGFFLSALAHGVTVLWLLWDSQTVPVAYRRYPLNWWLKATSLMSVVIPAVVSFFLHPGSGHVDARHTTIELAGGTQWGAVALIIVFFAFYANDFRAIRAFALRNANTLLSAGVISPDLVPPTDSSADHGEIVIVGAQDADAATLAQLLERVLTLDDHVEFCAGRGRQK